MAASPSTPRPQQDPRFFFCVSFREKDDAKALGARWSPERRLWYAEDAATAAKLRARWRPIAHEPMSPTSPATPSRQVAPATPSRQVTPATRSTTAPVYFAISYDDKDAAKALGAQWNQQHRLWYADDAAAVASLKRRWPLASESPAHRKRAREASGAPAIAGAGQPDEDRRRYYAVAYAEKDEAKAVGAKWDAEAKLWYAPTTAEATALEAKGFVRANTEPVVLAHEDRRFGGNTLFIDLIPRTAWCAFLEHRPAARGCGLR